MGISQETADQDVDQGLVHLIAASVEVDILAPGHLEKIGGVITEKRGEGLQIVIVTVVIAMTAMIVEITEDVMTVVAGIAQISGELSTTTEGPGAEAVRRTGEEEKETVQDAEVLMSKTTEGELLLEKQVNKHLLIY